MRAKETGNLFFSNRMWRPIFIIIRHIPKKDSEIMPTRLKRGDDGLGIGFALRRLDRAQTSMFKDTIKLPPIFRLQI